MSKMIRIAKGVLFSSESLEIPLDIGVAQLSNTFVLCKLKKPRMKSGKEKDILKKGEGEKQRERNRRSRKKENLL